MMDEKQALVPRLRFPEFLKSGEWEERSLGTQGDFLSSLSGKTAKDFDIGKAKFIPYMNVFSNTFSDVRDLRAVDVAEGESQNAVAKGDVFFTVSSETPEDAGMSSVLLEAIDNCYLNSFCAMFRFYNKRSPNPVFLGYWLRSGLVRAHLSRGAQGATRYNISKPVFREVPLLLPRPQEQQKIANCLSSLDALIAAQSDKVDALKTHKKGLMQQLFPREGETVPRLRFPEFRDAGNWERLPLGEIVDFMSGGTPSKDRADYWGGDIPWVSAASMHEISIDRSDRNITQSAVDDGARVIPKGTLLILVRGSMLHKRIPIGITACKVAFNQDVKALQMKSDISEEFLLHILISNEARLLCAVSGTGIGAGKLDTGELEEFLICVPEMKEERQRIASCLSSLDILIAAHTEKLDSLKTHKKGLMQQLFPSPEAVGV